MTNSSSYKSYSYISQNLYNMFFIHDRSIKYKNSMHIICPFFKISLYQSTRKNYNNKRWVSAIVDGKVWNNRWVIEYGFSSKRLMYDVSKATLSVWYIKNTSISSILSR